MKAPLFIPLLLMTLSFFTTSLFGQTPDSLGLDNKSALNGQESLLLNSLLQKQQGTFDFTGKKVAFVTGSSGGRLVSKSDYFNKLVKPWTEQGSSPEISLVQLTEEEKRKSGGYDAIVLSWVKLFTDRQRNKIVTRLQSLRCAD